MDIDQADVILSKMEEQTRARLGSDTRLSEPECEIHISNEQTELQEHLNNISSLRDLFVKQSQTLALMDSGASGYGQRQDSAVSSGTIPFPDNMREDASVGSCASRVTGCRSFEETLEEVTETLERSYVENLREISPTSVTATGVFNRSSLHGVERMLDFEENDDIDSMHLSIEGTDSEIQAAINEIRKEASQMDIVMALDRLKTMETELEVTLRALRERSTEAEGLKQQLEEKEEKVSCLQLERDLFKADASKLRDDLKTCVDRMFDISAVAGSSTLSGAILEPHEGVEKVEAVRDQAILRPASSHRGSEIPPIPSSTPLDSASETDKRYERVPQANRSPPIRRMISKSDPTVSSQFKAREDSTIADAFPFISANHSSGIFRANSQAPSPTKTLSMHSMSTNSSPLEYRRRHRSFSEVIRSSSRPIAENDEADSNGGEKRMCGLFRRRQQKRPLTNAKDVAIMRDKIDQLHMMMRASLETSEKLRKRLAMISRYYEGIIKKLQEQMVEIKTEKARLKAEIDSKISAMDHEQRTAIMQLENKLRQRDEEIRILTEKLNAPRCEI